MSQAAELYARWLADYYLLATILLALSLIGNALQKQPVRRLAVAKSTLVSLILLAVLCAIPGWSVVHLLTEERPQSVPEFHDEIFSAKPVVRAERVRPMVSDAPPMVHEDAAVPATPDSRPEPSFDFHLPWPALFAMTHLGGATGIVLWLVLGWIASARLRRTAQPAPTDLVAVLNQVFGQTLASTQRPQLLTHERIDVAVALGALRPTILLPGRWIRDESPDHLRTVLAHESTHIINHDLRWVALTRMLFIALWANPLFWITRRWLRRDQEALADAAAAELTSRQRYAEQLVAWARDAHSRPTLHLSSAVGLWEGPSQLRQRIALLIDEHFVLRRDCPRAWRLASYAFCVTAALALSLVTIAAVPVDDTRPTSADAVKSADRSSVNKSEQKVLVSTDATKPKANANPQKALFDLYRKHFKLPEPNVVGGFVADEKLQPIANAKVSVFRTNWRDHTRKLIAEKSTDADGKVRFDQVFDIAKEFPGGKIPPDYGIGEELLQVVVRAPGRVTNSHLQARQLVAKRGEPLMVIMPPAATLRGRVTGPDGKPIAGALVAVGTGSLAPWAEAMTARTDADGNYVIDDVPQFDLKAQAEQEAAMRSRKDAAMNAFRASPQVLILTVEHPNFAVGKAQIEKTPGTTDIQLQPAAILAGHIVFGDSGKPAGGARVWIAGHHQKLSETKRDDAGNNDEQRRYAMPFYTASTRADSDGKYRFATLPPGYYHLLAEMPGWVHVGLRDVSAEAVKTTAVPDLTLTKGGTVSVRLVNAKTREPIQVPPEALALINSSERPIFDRPPIEQRVSANKNGFFELSLPAGKHEIYIGAVYVGEEWKWSSDYSSITESPNAIVMVTEGKTAHADIRVIDAKSAQATRAMIVPGPLPKAEPKAQPRTKKKQPPATKASKADKDAADTAPITISGQAIGKNLQPLAGATIYLASLQSESKRVAQTVSDKDGKYAFDKIPLPIKKADTPRDNDSGGFEVFGVADGYGLSWREQKFFYPQRDHCTDEYVDPDGDGPRMYGSADPIDLDLQFGPATNVRGRVVDDHGKPIAGTLLDIRDADSQWNQAEYNTFKGIGALPALNERDIVPRELKTRTTDSNGNFEFTGLPLNHRFWIWVHPPGFPMRRVWAVTNDSVDTAAKGPDVYTGDVELVFATPRKVPILVVYADTGKPAPKVYVSADGSDGTTDDAGQVDLTLPDGEYRVHMLQRIGTPYRRSESPLVVSETLVKQRTRAELQPAGVADISVTDADTGKPLVGVDLWRQEPGANAANPHRNVYGYRSWEVETRISHYEQHRTDKNGKMRVLFDPGEHRIGVGLRAFPDGYEPVDPDGKVVELEAGKPQPIQFQMRKQAQPAGGAAAKPAAATIPKPDATELTGRVDGPDGKPLAGVTVDAYTWYPGNETKTDDEGRFLLKNLDPREPVEIEFRKAGFGPRHFNTQHTGIKSWVVQMDDSTFMEGQVVDPQGEPVPSALIRAERKALNEQGNELGEVFTDVRTDKNGNFRLYLEPDKYGIKVRVPGRGVARYEQQTITKGEKKLFNINLERGQTFRAVVLDAISRKPVEGIILFNWQHKGTEGKSIAAGLLEVPDMFPGKFEFQITAAGKDRMRSSVAGNYARWWSEQATEERERRLTIIRYGLNGNWDDLSFDIGTDSQPATIYLEPCVTVTGRVIDPDGKPVAGATVAPAATGSGNSLTGDTRYSYETKDDGTFEMKLPASGTGKYNLVAHDGKYKEWRKWANVAGNPFQTQPGDRIDKVELRLTRPATIRGRAMTDLRNPIANHEIRAADVEGHDNRYYVPTTKTDAKGNFELKFVGPGKHFVQLADTLDPKDAESDTSTVVDVKEGESIDKILIAPPDARSEIKAKAFLDADGHEQVEYANRDEPADPNKKDTPTAKPAPTNPN